MESCSPVPPIKDEETVRSTKDEGPVPPKEDEGPVPPKEDEGPVPPKEDEGPLPSTEDEELSQCLSLDSATTESSTPVPLQDSIELLAQSLPVTVPSEQPTILSSPSNIPQKSLNYNKSPKDVWKGAFVPSKGRPDLSAADSSTSLFPSFLNSSRSELKQEIKQDDSNQNSDKNANLNLANYTKDERGVDCNPNQRREAKLLSSDESSEGSNVDVKPCLACESEVGAFLLECQNAPPLASFANQPTLREQLSDITRKIEEYEEIGKEIDAFVEAFDKSCPDE